jgi:hypothetical protein
MVTKRLQFLPAMNRLRSAMRPRSAASCLGLALFFVLVGLMVSPNAQASSRGANSAVRLEVVACPTRYASPLGAKGGIGSKATVEMPKGIIHSFGLYTDSDRTMAPILAPRGWRCKAEIYEDGSATVAVSPTGDSLSPKTGVIATTDGGCQGCIADKVCPYFENAETQIGYSGTNCSTPTRKNEQVDYVSGSNTSSHGVVDISSPSTKQNNHASYEVLRYSDNTNGEAMDASETCSLPKNDSTWCRAITNEFVATNWEFDRTQPSVPATTTTTSPASSLIETLQAFFANGCNGGCSAISEPTSAFTLSFDPNNPNWAKWTVNDPNFGVAYGFFEHTNGLWQGVAGPGSDDVGCPGATGAIPTQVLSDFGETCSGSDTGNASSGTSGTSGNTDSGGPSSEQLQEAYRAGSLEGENLAASGSTPQFAINGDCRTFSFKYSDAAEQAQYQDGCLTAAG